MLRVFILLTLASPAFSQSAADQARALFNKARMTGDLSYLAQAETALQGAKGAQDEYEAQRLRVAILLERHEFAAALKKAAELNKKVPDDVAGWGLLADANIALGNYEAAEKDVQWMLDLRPGNVPAFIKAAELRELFGDNEGAIDFIDEAIRRTPETSADDQAWLLTQRARLLLSQGSAGRAQDSLDRALKLVPEYHLALGAMASVRTAQGKLDEAVELLQRRQKAVPSVAGLYDLAQALERSGRKNEATTLFQEFENRAQADRSKAYNANRELALYYADRAKRPADALAVAEREIALRQDIGTLDAYAWALYRNGKLEAAKTQMEKALAVGVRDPAYFCHAEQIALSLKDEAAAVKYGKGCRADKSS